MLKPAPFVALLRGINVGKAKRIAMADLRQLVEELGFGQVQTLLNSGNIVFTARPRDAITAADRIQTAIASTLGVCSRVTVISAAELAQAIAADPLTTIAVDPSKMLFAVAADPLGMRVLQPLARQDWAPEALALSDRIAWIWTPHGVLESKAAAAINRVLKDAVTMRNSVTMEKLHALCIAIM